MKKFKSALTTIAIVTYSLMLFSSCNNSGKDAQAVIDKYCELNTKVHNAAEGAAKDAAMAEKKAYEKEVDDKYFNDSKTYQIIMEGVKKCDEMNSENKKDINSSATNADAELPSAYGDALSVANNYCALVDKAIAAAQGGNEAELKKIMAAKVIFENNMNESFKDKPERRDTIFKLIEPCMKKEVRMQNQ
ncbi:MAG: hypothetical protein KF825_10585 [Ferruginibacter sp.]|nr:hypothetical protein [Ferruginibacter sp.]